MLTESVASAAVGWVGWVVEQYLLPAVIQQRGDRAGNLERGGRIRVRAVQDPAARLLSDRLDERRDVVGGDRLSHVAPAPGQEDGRPAVQHALDEDPLPRPRGPRTVNLSWPEHSHRCAAIQQDLLSRDLAGTIAVSALVVGARRRRHRGRVFPDRAAKVRRNVRVRVVTFGVDVDRVG